MLTISSGWPIRYLKGDHPHKNSAGQRSFDPGPEGQHSGLF